jgi:hypothetical protein
VRELAGERRRGSRARRSAPDRIVGRDRVGALAVQDGLASALGDAELDRQGDAVDAADLVDGDRRLRQRDDPRLDRVDVSERRTHSERVDEPGSQRVRHRGLRNRRTDGRDREPAGRHRRLAQVVPAAAEEHRQGERGVDSGSPAPENRAAMGDRRALLALALVLTPRGSRAEEPAPVDAPAPVAAAAHTEVAPDQRRAYAMEANLRVRYLSIPSSVMDIWYFDADDAGANPLARPQVRAYAVGAEWVVDKAPDTWIFYAEWVGIAMEDGYWDDVESSPANHSDGVWVEPDGFGLVVLGANYGHGIRVREWLDFLVGGGLGLGFVTGELTVWNAGTNADTVDATCLRSAAAYERHESCGDDGAARVPGLVPVIDLTASARFHFGDQATVRLDAGLHDVLYAGTAVGVVF